MSALALIGMGSNLGDRRRFLDSAVEALRSTPGNTLRAISSYHETVPVGGPGGQGAFLNAAAVLETTLDPESLLAALNAIEDHAGRRREVRWGERTLDLDILIYDNLLIETPRLCVPHRLMALRRFVLAPLVEVAPSTIDPRTGWTMVELLANLDRRPSHVALLGADGPIKTAVFRRLLTELGAEGLTSNVIEARLSSPNDPPMQRLNPCHEEPVSPHEDWRDRWLVSGFWSRADSLKGVDPSNREPGRSSSHSSFKHERGGTLQPTFAVVLGNGPDSRRSNDRPAIPLLRPESCDPDKIVVEIVSACAATRSGGRS